jgi:hypothetical protein
MKTLTTTESQILELASELAHNRAADYLFNDELISDEDDMFIEKDGILIYTDRSQDEFNRCYDYYLTIINSILK